MTESTESLHDVVIVGAGVAGALVAKLATHAGLRVLLLEAGPASAETLEGYEAHLQTFYRAASKGSGSAWPPNENAPQPDTSQLRWGNGYFVQHGPDLYGSAYSRLQGGSTLHWLGVCLRMLPEDLELRSRHGVGRDWPLRYEDLEPYYRKAEWEIGVSADADEQAYLGVTFPSDYDYPMHRIPPSYADRKLAAAIDGTPIALEEDTVSVKVRGYPAARNSTPRSGYTAIGAVDRRPDGLLREHHLGERCQGNTACTPICPVQAKYHAGKTLAQARGDRLQVLAQAVASRIDVDPVTGAVESITYKRYDGATHTVHRARGRVYVLAAHAVENAKLLLASDLTGPKDLVGRHLMDHPALYAWGLWPEPIGAFRGPLSTSGIEDLRGGAFRKRHAAFRFDVGNDGWRATTGAPDSTVEREVRNNRFGRDLRNRVADLLTRQVRLSLAVEQLGDPENRVTLDRRFVDPLGNPRPAIHYRIDDYTKAGMEAATRTYKQLFARAGVIDHTDDDQSLWFPSVKYRGTVYFYHGMGHFAGTHLMGRDRTDSVVDHTQRAWDHPNLYLVGSGSFPTMGTSNPTLTLAALSIRTAEHLIRGLTQEVQEISR